MLSPRCLTVPRWVADPAAHFAAPIVSHLFERLAPKRTLSVGDPSGDLVVRLDELAGDGEIIAVGKWAPPRRVKLERLVHSHTRLLDEMPRLPKVDFALVHSLEWFREVRASLGRRSIVVFLPPTPGTRWNDFNPYFTLGESVGVVAWGVDVQLDELVPEPLRPLFAQLGNVARDWARTSRDRAEMFERVDAAETALDELRVEAAGLRRQLGESRAEVGRQARDRARLQGMLEGTA